MHTIKCTGTDVGEGDEGMAFTPGKWIHMVGIAGAGMSGIARVLAQQGYKVSGSDLQVNDTTSRLEEIGVEIFKGHSSSNLKEGVDLLVTSSAVPQDNIELRLAREKKIPILKRGQMLAHLANAKKAVAVAGAHGKTTTTSMLYMVLANCGTDPSFIVGGELQGSELNAKLGRGDYFVVEADESDASFLDLRPYIALITNVEDDHLDYYKSVDNIRKAFRQFVEQIRPEGFAMLYGGDAFNRSLVKDLTLNKRLLFYGEDLYNDYYFLNWESIGLGSRFDVYKRDLGFLGRFELAVPGKHNALNALAAIASALELGLEMEPIKSALKNFHGARRRFQIQGQKALVTVVDDYAHHPTEIRATIDAARNFHSGRVMVLFQPHRYSRTQLLGRQLGEALINADLAIITEVYSAGEEAIPGISGEVVCQAAQNIGCHSVYIPQREEIIPYLLQISQENDLIITMGAGDIWKLGLQLLEVLPESVLKV
jgi:UDP-N-acetylmuramate--alanine ligase